MFIILCCEVLAEALALVLLWLSENLYTFFWDYGFIAMFDWEPPPEFKNCLVLICCVELAEAIAPPDIADPIRMVPPRAEFEGSLGEEP